MQIASPKWDVCLLTENRYLERSPDNAYISNIFLEDDILLKELDFLGLRCVRKSWEDSAFDWRQVRFILFRTPWNYFERFSAFSVWLDSISRHTQLLNHESLIRWNLNKAYLWDLASKGVPVMPGFFFGKGLDVSAGNFCRLAGWKEAVFKPAVSGTARHTYRIMAEDISKPDVSFHALLEEEPMLLQEFQESVISRGEVSLVLIGGKFSHAVLKRAKPGDFRVQDDFGGSLHDYIPDAEEIHLAESALAKCPKLPVYARVDIIRNNRNEVMLTELELIEPELWFRREPAAAHKLARLIKLHLDSN